MLMFLPTTCQYKMVTLSVFFLLVLTTSMNPQLKAADAKNLGACYGRLSNNLPPPEESVRLLETYKIGRLRIYAPDHRIFRALNGSNVQLTVGIPNQEVHVIAANLKGADMWFRSNIEPYVGYVWFRYVVVGHDDVINENSAKDVLQAMNNLYTIISNHHLQTKIKITTEVGSNVLGDYHVDASEGSFKYSPKSGPYMDPIIKFLASHNSPLFVINYPHTFYLANNEESWKKKNNFDFTDPMNIFFGTIDVFYSAMAKVGGEKVRVVVGETGWPSAGGDEIANAWDAKKYVWELARRVLSSDGTGMRPGGQIETYVYALYNENLREGMWKNFGMFYPDMKPVYGIPPLQ